MSGLGVSHCTSFAVSWGDCDPAGIVFYPRYFEWFDRSAHLLFESVGLDHHAIVERWNAVGLSLVDVGATFRRPATYGTCLDAHSRITRIGRSSLTVGHVLRIGEDTVVEGHETRVWVTRSTGNRSELRSAHIPDEVRRLLQHT